MVSTVSWWDWGWVFLGLMSVLCSCKAWIHSSGALPDSPLAKAFTRGREGAEGGVHLSLNNSLCLSLPPFPVSVWYSPCYTSLSDPLSCPLSTQSWWYFRINPWRKLFPFTAQCSGAVWASSGLQSFWGGGIYYLSAVVWFTVFIVVSINRDPDTFRLTHFTSQSVQ